MGKQQTENKIPQYRLTLSDERAGREIRTLRFSGAYAIIYSLAALILFVGLIYCLIAFTPIRTGIPGYPDAHAQKEAVANAIKIDSLESVMTRWELYAENLSRVLSGTETISLDSILRGNAVKYLSEKSREELARQDSLLRAGIDSEGKVTDGQEAMPLEGMLFFTPLKGVVSKGFDLVSHTGVDITAPEGTAVCAALDGTIVSTGWSDTEGYTLVLQHAGDAITIYSHIEKLLKGSGDKVKAGTPVALVGGSTDNLTAGSHLHFELWYKGDPQDPAKHISF
jgi:murein DD-endopeptidase MepM/ murein hydrolase activator NlpD